MTRKCQASFNDGPEETDLSKPVGVWDGLRSSDGSLSKPVGVWDGLMPYKMAL